LQYLLIYFEIPGHTGKAGHHGYPWGEFVTVIPQYPVYAWKPEREAGFLTYNEPCSSS
jgi:hypothetical protein